MRGTTLFFKHIPCDVTISIHVPREGDDASIAKLPPGQLKFQSTSPVRGTTKRINADVLFISISIHVPREGDDDAMDFASIDLEISIHVPREGDDHNDTVPMPLDSHFNPRPP